MSDTGIQYFPITLPPNTVVGRLGNGTPGITEAIPLDVLAKLLPIPNITFYQTTDDLLSSIPADVTLIDKTVYTTSGRNNVGDQGGTSFYYDASDTTTADNGGNIRVDTHGRRFKALRPSEGFSLRLWGPKADGVTDDTAVFIAAFAACAGDVLFIPDGEYAVPGSVPCGINLPANGITIIGNNPDTTTIVGLTGSSYPLFGSNDDNPSHDVVVRNVGFRSTYDKNQVAFYIIGGNVHDWTIENCRCDQISLIYSQTPADFASITPADMAHNIIIRDCRGYGDPTHGGPASFGFINMYYTYNWQISGCYAQYYLHGIVWWGGDSNYSVNGNPANDRHCFNGLIENCVVRNVTSGGIWGSMGKNIKIVGCQAITGGDVGLDAEGCWEVTFSDCYVQDFTNGCLTAFWCNEGVVFKNCDVYMSSGTYTIAARTYNATLNSSLNESVIFDGGTWVHATGLGFADNGNGPTRYAAYKNLVLRDVCINYGGGENSHLVFIDNNIMLYTRDLGTGNCPIRITGLVGVDIGGGARIKGNRIHAIATQSNSVAAINCASSDTNFTSTFDIDGNDTHGWASDIVVASAGGTDNSKFKITNNFCGNNTITTSGVVSPAAVIKPTNSNYGYNGSAL